MTCTHRQRLQKTIRAFRGPIPGARENRAAHGGIEINQRCPRCGARRTVNQNGRHVECGPWIPEEPQP